MKHTTHSLSKRSQYTLCIATLVLAYVIFISLGNLRITYTPQRIADSLEGTQYFLDGSPVIMRGGRVQSSARRDSILNYFGNETVSDLNGDGMKDITFILTESRPHGEVYYYLALALHSQTGYIGLNTVYLGDRITPQIVDVRDREITVRYKRHIESGHSSPLSVLKYFIVRNNLLTEIAK